MKCSKCGKINPPSSQFCQKCGADLREVPKEKKNRKMVPVLVIVGALFVFVLIIGAVSGIHNKEKVETPPPAGPAEEITVEESATPPPVPAQEPAPAPAPTWQTVIDVTSNADKRTAPFSLGSGQKKLLYNVTGGSSGLICAIYVIKEGSSLATEGGSPEVMISDPGPGETALVNEPGNYYLDVSAANCSWQVTIQELK